MKKAVSIFAVVVMSVGLFTACESETSIEESDALYEMELQAGDGEMTEVTGRP